MKKCSRCNNKFSWDKEFCPICGGAVIDVPDEVVVLPDARSNSIPSSDAAEDDDGISVAPAALEPPPAEPEVQEMSEEAAEPPAEFIPQEITLQDAPIYHEITPAEEPVREPVHQAVTPPVELVPPDIIPPADPLPQEITLQGSPIYEEIIPAAEPVPQEIVPPVGPVRQAVTPPAELIPPDIIPPAEPLPREVTLQAAPIYHEIIPAKEPAPQAVIPPAGPIPREITPPAESIPQEIVPPVEPVPRAAGASPEQPFPEAPKVPAYPPAPAPHAERPIIPQAPAALTVDPSTAAQNANMASYAAPGVGQFPVQPDAQSGLTPPPARPPYQYPMTSSAQRSQANSAPSARRNPGTGASKPIVRVRSTPQLFEEIPPQFPAWPAPVEASAIAARDEEMPEIEAVSPPVMSEEPVQALPVDDIPASPDPSIPAYPEELSALSAQSAPMEPAAPTAWDEDEPEVEAVSPPAVPEAPVQALPVYDIPTSPDPSIPAYSEELSAQSAPVEPDAAAWDEEMPEVEAVSPPAVPEAPVQALPVYDIPTSPDPSIPAYSEELSALSAPVEPDAAAEMDEESPEVEAAPSPASFEDLVQEFPADDVPLLQEPAIAASSLPPAKPDAVPGEFEFTKIPETREAAEAQKALKPPRMTAPPSLTPPSIPILPEPPAGMQPIRMTLPKSGASRGQEGRDSQARRTRPEPMPSAPVKPPVKEAPPSPVVSLPLDIPILSVPEVPAADIAPFAPVMPPEEEALPSPVVSLPPDIPILSVPEVPAADIAPLAPVMPPEEEEALPSPVVSLPPDIPILSVPEAPVAAVPSAPLTPPEEEALPSPVVSLPPDISIPPVPPAPATPPAKAVPSAAKLASSIYKPELISPPAGLNSAARKKDLSPALAGIMGVDSISDIAPPSDAAEEPLPLDQAVSRAGVPETPETPNAGGSGGEISEGEEEGNDDTKKIARRLYDEPPPESEFLRMFPDARA